ncbi:radial spoke head protein 4 homolog A isoform X2 [Macrosteles quadrilineatus]|nr:radial spoke head protein 4 homolog A isoform X2 [Macrosteles quadrilineatus]
MEEKKPPTQTDLEETAFYFLEAGIAIPNIQIFNINIALKKLAEENNLEKSRFWGQIFGTAQDYFVLEYELSDEEYQKRIELDDSEDTTETESKDQAEQDNEDDNEDETGKEDTLRSSTVDDGGVKESVTSAIESLRSAEKQESIDSKHYMQKIYIKEEKSGESLAQEGLEEEEDPLLPPLPPPRKLLSYKIPPLLQPVIKETIKIPAERLGEGINKKIYYVCNTPELEWTELPKVTPEQINVAQQIKAYFTGNLESKIVTYPAFPGQEKHYLRAQIARISAATHVSPVGFYKFSGGEEDEEEEELAEEEEEEGNQKNIEQNKKYQPIPVKELTDPSLTSWVHHSRYILKQGRVDWWSTKKTIVGEEEAEEEQEEEEDEDKEGGEEKETGPALLTPLSEDTPVDSLPAWTVRRTRSYNPNMAGAVVRSTRWPGAAAVAVGKRCDNVYCGWGHKLNLSGFSPASLPHPEYEYDLGPEVLEIQDPTVEVEQAWREAHKKKPPPKEGEEEEEDEEGEEDEEEEEDEDD